MATPQISTKINYTTCDCWWVTWFIFAHSFHEYQQIFDHSVNLFSLLLSELHLTNVDNMEMYILRINKFIIVYRLVKIDFPQTQ